MNLNCVKCDMIDRKYFFCRFVAFAYPFLPAFLHLKKDQSEKLNFGMTRQNKIILGKRQVK